MEHYDVVIVGCGFSGLLCSHYLKESGIDNVCVFEMNSSLGGVWSHGGVGSYPGAACDVPSYTYLPFLDRTGFIPSKKYVSQSEISDYAEMLADHCGIREMIKFSRKVTKIEYVERGLWKISTADPRSGEPLETVTCQHVVSANGPLSSPRMPEVPGIDLFEGESFHTASWDQNTSLAGKRVGVIGTGASAAQVITSIVDEVESLTIFQRTPTWALPRDDEPTPKKIKDAFKAGGYGEKLRYIEWEENVSPDPNAPFTFEMLHNEEQNAAICAGIAARIKQEVDDPQLAELLTPDYPFFCKRVLFIDDYYTTFNKPHVHLIDEPGGVVRIHPKGLEIASGESYEFDVIIYATGFDSNFIPFPIIGKNGVTLADHFGANAANNFQMTDPKTLWGIHVNDLPNFYMMIGPQSLNPVTNVTLLCEEQSKYIASLVQQMKTNGNSEVEPEITAVARWSERCTETAEGKVWLRCNNWYTKSTKTDELAGRTRSRLMWMESYQTYLQHILGGADGSRDELLVFS